jgi:uroporphyrinogen-III decarboxylase
MTHKERVLKSLSHQEPDRIPFMYRDVPEVRSRLKKDLNLEELKKEYGDLITFSGGIDEQDLLPNGTPEMVVREVRKIIDIMAPGGGYFLGSTHNFQDDCPTENILAMYRTAGSI